MVKNLIIGLSVWAFAGHVYGQSELMPVQSRSGQFFARNLREQYFSPQQNISHQVSMAGAKAYILHTHGFKGISGNQTVEPALLAISCERVKSAILTELNLTDEWKGRINCSINALLPEDSEPLLTAIHSLDGWNYELEVPGSITTRHLSRAIVNVILLEIANRSAGSESTQIPLWLVEGFTSHIQADEGTLVVRPNQQMAGTQRVMQRIQSIRDRVREQAPMSFQELSWPDQQQIADTKSTRYPDCSQLFFYELLRMRDGRQCLSQFVNRLPSRLNWQLVFLEAYRSHFSQLREVEKWWSITCLNIVDQDETAHWSPKDSYQKIQEALNVPVKVHVDSDQLPSTSAVTLQEVIQQWDPTLKIATLQRTIARLQSMRTHIAPELAGLLNDYYATLDGYLQKNPSGWLAWIKADASSQRVKNSVCRQLTTLDERRAALKTKVNAPRRTQNPFQMSARQ